jgi:hypothetical protein
MSRECNAIKHRKTIDFRPAWIVAVIISGHLLDMVIPPETYAPPAAPNRPGLVQKSLFAPDDPAG